MSTPQEFYVLIPSTDPTRASAIYGPFSQGFRKGESAARMAELFAAKRPGAKVLGPFDPKKDPRRKRAKEGMMNPKPDDKELIEGMLKDLDRPKDMLSRWELDFLHSVKDQFDRRGSLSARQLEILDRIHEERCE